MRGGFGLLRNSNGVVRSRVIGEAAKLVSCSPFSTSSGGGGGRGRGSFTPTKFDFVVGGGSNSSPGEVVSNEGLKDTEKSYPGIGRGHGRGKPLAPSPIVPSANTFVVSGEPSQQQLGIGLGRGGPVKPVIGLGHEGGSGNEQVASGESSQPRPGIGLGRGGHEAESGNEPIGEKNLLKSVMTPLTGMGRGKTEKSMVDEEKPKEVNRHLGAGRGDDSGTGRGKNRYESKGIDPERKKLPKLSREEAVKRAVGILASKDGGREEGGRGGGEGEGRGRGRGGGGRGRGRRGSYEDDDPEEDAAKRGTGDPADGELVAKKPGTKVVADPVEDAYNEALDLHLKVEFEPEYLMGNFEENPDISENPPIPMRDALVMMKPVLMELEQMTSHEEWEDALEEAMKNEPELKAMLRHYAGPPRLTAKQQHAKLEKVAKRLPASAPDGVTNFTNRALLSLQSNPGWDINSKRKFMVKLVSEVSKTYK